MRISDWSSDVCASDLLQLLADVLVEALDAGQVVDRNEGDLLDRGEALGDQQMRDDVLDVEGVDEHLAAGVELVLAAAGFLLLGQDVDVPTGQDRRQPHVLAATPDRDRKSTRLNSSH